MKDSVCESVLAGKGLVCALVFVGFFDASEFTLVRGEMCFRELERTFPY